MAGSIDASKISSQPVYRWALRLAGYSFALSLLAVSATMNWHFGLSLGKGDVEQHLFGVASLAVDGLKALLPLFIIVLWRAAHRFAATVAAVLWCACFAWSMASAIGFSAATRETVQAERSGDIERRDSLQRRETELKSLLANVPPHRATNVVRSELQTVNVPVPVMRRTNGCTDFTREDSRQICEPALKLRRELAAAEEAEGLRNELKTVSASLYAFAGTQSVADPQVHTLAKLTGLSLDTVRVGLALLISILVELASAFGITLVALATSQETMKRLSLKAEARAVRDHARAERQLERLGAARQKPDEQSVARIADTAITTGSESETTTRDAVAVRSLREVPRPNAPPSPPRQINGGMAAPVSSW